MKSIITMILLLIVGQAYAGEQLIDVQHDSVRSVTCWIIAGTGISCLPDSSLLQAPGPAPTGESQAARASMGSNTVEYESFPAVSLPRGERFQL